MAALTPIPHRVDLSVKPDVTAFFDEPTNTVTYVVRDPASTSCAVFDSVMDIDYAAGRITYASADAVIGFIKAGGLTLEWLIETHVHADHLSAAPYIQGKLGGKIGIGENITVVQDTFGKVFNEGTEFQRDGSQFDQLFKDGDSYQIGEMTAFAIHTPGHTPACMTHIIGDAAFVGDTLFMPDGGSARADFPGGDAPRLRPERPPNPLGNHCGRTEGPQHSCQGRHHRRSVCASPRSPRCNLGHAQTDHPGPTGQHARRRSAPPDESGKRFLKVPINGL